MYRVSFRRKILGDMMSFEEHVSNSFYLSENNALKSFCDRFQSADILSEVFTVVCERKEDIKTIRDHIFGILKSQGYSEDVLLGISIYSLDSLISEISNLLATQEDYFKTEELSFFKKPYLTISEQEKIIDIFLNRIGYFLNDSRSIAKQIISFIDVDWPEDLNFVELISSVVLEERNQGKYHINDSFKFIVSVYHTFKFHFTHFSRLQSFLKQDFILKLLEPNYFDNVKKAILKIPALNSTCLWISAPEYVLSKEPFYDAIKPGNFQSSVVNDFFEWFHKVRGFNKKTYLFKANFLIEALKDKENKLENLKVDNFSIHTAASKHILNQVMTEAMSNSSVYPILGQLDSGVFQNNLNLFLGGYPYSEKDYKSFLDLVLNKSHFSSLSSYEKIIVAKMYTEFEEFIETYALLPSDDFVEKILIQYDIPFSSTSNESLLHHFKNYILNKNYTLSSDHESSVLFKTLAFLPGSQNYKHIICFGGPHTSSLTSLNVKILNAAIMLLRRNTKAIEIPSSEILYQGFWLNIFKHSDRVDLWFYTNQSQEHLDCYFNNVESISHMTHKLKSEYLLNSFSKYNSFQVPKIELLKDRISVTELEAYINCPLQYYFSHIIGLQERGLDLVEKDHLMIGQIAHKITEVLLKRLGIYVEKNNFPISIIAEIFDSLLELLNDKKLFLSDKKERWLESFKELNLIKGEPHLESAILEVTDLIFEESFGSIKGVYQREVIKRIFLKFLQSESSYIRKISQQKGFHLAYLLEYPIEFSIEDIKISGRIDRVDIVDGSFKIIDYKSSKISKNKSEKIVLLPSQKKLKTSYLYNFSIQGAMYFYGLLESLLEKGSFEEFENIYVSEFSLYKLKGLVDDIEPILSYHFSDDQKSFYNAVQEEYKPYLKSLKKGIFTPKPLLGMQTCERCSFQSICPLFKG